MSSLTRLRAAVATVASAGLLITIAGTVPATAQPQLLAPSAGNAQSVTVSGSASTAPSSYGQSVHAAGQFFAAAKAKARPKRVTKASVNLRRGPGKSYRKITVIRKGRVVRLLGKKANGYTKVTASGRKGWIASRYLRKVKKSSTSSSSAIRVSSRSYPSTERRLSSQTIRVHRALRARFPQIKTVYGYRPGSAGEHRLGRALDIMLPGNYRSASARALGSRIASWGRSNARSLRVMYVIWDQRIWNSARSGDGWRRMSDRGSASGNHKNHVHISVK
jgi:Bacterial SH3 domain